MSWAMGRRYSGTGETWRSPPERKAATAGGLSPLLPFPGMQPRYLSPSSLSSESPAAASTVGWAASGGPLPPQGLQPEPSHEAAATASADEEQLQSMLSALRVALSKKEAALVSVVGQLADVQGRLQVCEADKAELAGQVRDLQLAAGSAVPERLPVACSVMPDGRLIAQVRQELGREASRAAELAAERDALRQDVALLHQQLVAAAQAEAKERERLCIEATQGRLLARARARQVEQLQEELQQASRACISTSSVASKQADAAQAEAASAQAATAEASARAAAAEAEVAQLRQQLESARVITMQDGARVAAVEADLAEARQQMDWQTLCITELKQTSSMGQLMRKYEGEVQRLRAQFDADRRNLQEQLAQAQQQEQQVAVSSTADETALTQPQFSLDSSAWKALFDEETSQQLAAELQDAWSQTEASNTSSSPQHLEADPALLEAARLEIERLQELNRALLGSQTKAQQALQGSLEQQQHAAAAHEREAALHRAEVTEHHVALDAAWRAEAGLREQLLSVEHQLAHKSGEVEALREANDKLELAVAAFKEELDAARHVPKQEEQLRAELLQAVAHTESLEAQVQQLKQVAASTAQEHVAQQGATDTAAQVAAAVAAAAERHEQQVLDLHTQLAEAHQQLQAARSELSTLQLDQTLRAQLFVDQATQAAGCQVGLAQSSMQTDMWPPFADTSIPLVVGQALTARQPPLQPLNARMQQLPSGGASTCPSSACSSSSMGCRSPTTLPVETTAMQLQLELARVRIPPLKSLVACSSLRAGSQAQQMPSRLGSTHGEHASSLGCGSLSGLAALRQAQGWGASPQGDGNSSTQLMQAEEEEGDSCFATPLAQTPTSLLKGGLAPFGNALWHAEDASQHQQHQQEQQRRVPVPALNLQLVKKHSSPEFPQLTVDGSVSGLSEHDDASVSLSSLSSRASTSHMAHWAAAVTAATDVGSSSGVSPPPPLSSTGRHAANLGGIGTGSSSWSSASLDASLARLARLTAGLTTEGQ